MSIIQRVPWTVQPQVPVLPNPKFNLGFVIMPWLGVGSQDLISKQVLTKQAAGTTGVLSVASGGIGLFYASASSYAQYIPSSSFIPGTADFAVGLSGTFERVASKTRHPLSSFTNSSGASQWRFEPNSPDDSATTQGAICFLTYDGAITLVGATGAFADGEYANFLFVRRGTTHELWKNGSLFASATGTARNISTSPTIGFGSGSAYQNTSGGTRTLAYGINGSVQQEQASRLSSVPWQIFSPQTRLIWASAAGGTTTDGVISGTDGSDTTAVVAETWTTAQIAATDGGDVFDIAATVTTGAAITGTDGADNAVIAAETWTTAQIVATDGSDLSSVLADASGATLATIAVTDGADAASVYAANWTTALLASVDGADAATIDTTVTTGAAIAGTDGWDVANIVGYAAGTTTLTAADLAAIDALITAQLPNIAAAVLAAYVEGTTTVQQALRLYDAVLGGKVSGAGTGTETFRDLADTKDRVVATVDSNGNRTAITRDLS